MPQKVFGCPSPKPFLSQNISPQPSRDRRHLAGYANVLNVRTQAPFPIRIRRIIEEQNICPIQAETLVNENDVVRANFIESSYKVRWDTATLFDLVIDTSKVPPQAAVVWLVETNTNLNQRTEDGLLTTEKINVQRVLAGVVTEVLNCQSTH